MSRLKAWIIASLTSIAISSSVCAERTLVTELDIPAPVKEVWTAFTTAEGFKSWAVKQAEFDFRVGGEMRTSYNAESTLRDEHTIVNKVLAFEPERMLAIQNAQAPKGFANAHLFQQTWSVIYFEPVSQEVTHVRIVGMGYGEGADWDDIYSKFEAGNAYTLELLRKKFAGAHSESGGAKADEERPETPPAIDILRQMAGGEWIHESTNNDGEVFRVRNVMELGPDGECIVGRGFLGDEQGMYDHGATIVYREPVTRRTMFISVNEDGSVARGEIRTLDDKTVEWDWNMQTPEGAEQSFRVHSHLPSRDRYTFTLWRKDDAGAWVELIDLEYERVEKAPPVFYKMKAGDHD